MQERLAAAGCKLTRAVILRGPIDKELSLLKHNHGWNAPVFEDVLSRVSDDVELENGQVRYILNNLADSKHPVPTGLAADDVRWQRALHEAVRILEQFKFIGFVEHLPAQLDRLAALLGFKTSAAVGKANQNSASGVLKDLPARLQQRISELVQVDIQLYQKARDMNGRRGVWKYVGNKEGN